MNNIYIRNISGAVIGGFLTYWLIKKIDPKSPKYMEWVAAGVGAMAGAKALEEIREKYSPEEEVVVEKIETA